MARRAHGRRAASALAALTLVALLHPKPAARPLPFSAQVADAPLELRAGAATAVFAPPSPLLRAEPPPLAQRASARVGRTVQLARVAQPTRACVAERCDGVDNDCDGEVDEPGAIDCTLFYEDRDGDQFGGPVRAGCLCEPGPGLAANNLDCDDTDRFTHPGALEQCDGEIDNDCDGAFDLCGATSRQELQLGDLVVERFLDRPVGRIDPDGEWFEIANRTDRAYELMGLEFRDDGVDHFRVDRSLVIPPRGRLVLGRNGDPATNGGRAIDYVYPDFILSNFGDAIEIVNRGRVIDRITYTGR